MRSRYRIERRTVLTGGAALALAAIRKKGLDAVPQAALPLFTRPQSTFLGSASQVEAYVYALARFEAKPAHFPKASSKRSGPLRAQVAVSSCSRNKVRGLDSAQAAPAS